MKMSRGNSLTRLKIGVNMKYTLYGGYLCLSDGSIYKEWNINGEKQNTSGGRRQRSAS